MERSTSKKHPLVEVHWVDIFGKNDAWTSLEEWTDPGEAEATTVGYLIPDIKEGYTVLAGSYIKQQTGECWHEFSFIPNEVVRKIVRLSRSGAL